MGSSIGGGAASGGKRRRGRRGAPMAEINMTPFIDVMLVLLIVFMVAAPLLTVGVPIDLPQSQAQALNQDNEPLTISVDGKGEIFLQETKVTIEEIVPKLQALAKQGLEERIFVRGDKTVNYGQIMQVMGRVSGAGFKKVALVTEQEN
ncbi:MAG: protein TolR [Labrys sp. (in: a-proteobacteria)]|jgi:biopolymer transport protein TolR